MRKIATGSPLNLAANVITFSFTGVQDILTVVDGGRISDRMLGQVSAANDKTSTFVDLLLIIFFIDVEYRGEQSAK